MKLKFNKASFSSSVLGVFIASLLISGLVTEFFRAPQKTDNIVTEYTSLFKPGDLAKVQKVHFKNGLGDLVLEKSNEGWEIKSPRMIRAKSLVVQKIIQNIEGIKVKKIFSKDPINISNFSLNPPLISVSFFFKDGESFQIDHGLIDSITNSTYITHSKKSYIYQTALLEDSFERYDLATFIDSRVFTPETGLITEIKVFRGKMTSKSLAFGLKLKEGQWLGIRTGRTMSADRVKYYLDSLFSLKSNFIMDQMTEKLEKGLERYIDRPAYEVELTTNAGTTLRYTLTGLVDSLPGINIDRRQNFVIQAPDRRHPFLLHKDHYKLFSLSEYDFLNRNKKPLSF